MDPSVTSDVLAAFAVVVTIFILSWWPKPQENSTRNEPANELDSSAHVPFVRHKRAVITDDNMKDDTSNDADNNASKCAACGKGNVVKTCGGCKMVKYCSAACQKSHRPQHKKECAKELHDEALFKQPPLREECLICMLPLPLTNDEVKYQACCGKYLCIGCIHAAHMADDRCLCPFCRTPEVSSVGEANERLKNRVKAGDAVAMHQLGCDYRDGRYGLRNDPVKAMELWLRAGELGCAQGYGDLGNAYFTGDGVQKDLKKAKHYLELAVMGGDMVARHNLGILEMNAGNWNRAVKHWMISAEAGDNLSLKAIRECYLDAAARLY